MIRRISQNLILSVFVLLEMRIPRSTYDVNLSIVKARARSDVAPFAGVRKLANADGRIAFVS